MRMHRPASVALALMMSVAGGALVAVPAAASRSAAPVDFEDYDQARVDELLAEGFSEGEALFLALTKVEGKAVGDDRVRITNTFPTGNQAVIDIRIVPADTGDPDSLKVKTGPAGKDFKFSLDYFVSYDAIPVDAQPAVALGGDAAGPVASVASFGVPTQGGDDPHGVQVLVQGLVDQARGDKVDAFVEELDKKLKNPKLDKLNKKLKGALVANDLLDMGLTLAGLMAELDALEECAKNPTKTLTKKAYKENPGERDRILKQIADARAEIKGNSAANVIGAVNSAGSGLIKGVPWLGYVIGPGTAWAKETMDKINREHVDDIKKSVVPCEYDLKIDGTAGTPPAHLTSLKCGGPVGTWDIAYEQPGAISAGHISVTIAKDGSGTWQAAGTASGRDSGNGGTVALKMSGDGKSGTLTFSLLGSVAVTGGEFCAKGKAPGG